MRGRTLILILLAAAAVPVVVFRLSPHGGIVPFWRDEMGLRKFSGGDGTNLSEAVVISNGARAEAKTYEIEWLRMRGVGGVDFESFVSKRVTTNGQTIDVVTVEGRDYFFNVSSLKVEPRLIP